MATNTLRTTTSRLISRAVISLSTKAKTHRQFTQTTACITTKIKGGLTTGNVRQNSRNFTKDSREPTLIREENAADILSKYDTLLLDCDGVLWSADHYTKFPNTSKTMKLLSSMGLSSMLVTNNSIPTRQELQEKCRDLGGFDVELENIYSVAYIAGLYLKNTAKITGKCYLLGSEGMHKEFIDLGIDVIGYGPDPDPVSLLPADLLNQSFSDNVEAVALGFDIHFCYNKLYKAISYLENPSCHLVATNDKERSLVLAPGRRQPLTAMMVDAVRETAGREAVVLGKPHPRLWECIRGDRPGVDPARTLMVGDSPRTDVQFARGAGLDSVLVLSGATSHRELSSVQPKPTYVLESFADLYKLL